MATPPKPQSSPPPVADQDSVERLQQARDRLKTEIAKLVVG